LATRRISSPIAAGLLILCVSGCEPDLTCDESFTSGGDLLGAVDNDGDGTPDVKWVVVDPCEDLVNTPPLQDTLVGQPPHLAGDAPPDPASGDWCMNLSFRIDGSIENLNTWFPRLPLRPHSPIAAGKSRWYDASLSYEGNSYSFAAILYGRQKLELSSRCLTSQGVSLSCEQLTSAIAMAWNSEPAVQNLVCGNHPSGSGCECQYDLVLNTGPAGTWAAGGGVVTHFDSMQGPPFQADYSVEGNTLSMSGHERRALFGINGMRTLKFSRVVCNDGQQGPGEDGVDCGPHCTTACP
jgi:hypothetical protein